MSGENNNTNQYYDRYIPKCNKSEENSNVFAMDYDIIRIFRQSEGARSLGGADHFNKYREGRNKFLKL